MCVCARVVAHSDSALWSKIKQAIMQRCAAWKYWCNDVMLYRAAQRHQDRCLWQVHYGSSGFTSVWVYKQHIQIKHVDACLVIVGKCHPYHRLTSHNKQCSGVNSHTIHPKQYAGLELNSLVSLNHCCYRFCRCSAIKIKYQVNFAYREDVVLT